MSCPRIGLWRETINRIVNPPKLRTFDFICKYVRNHKGEPFNPFDYPWTQFICDTWDRPEISQITLQFAARLGKTVLAMSMMVAAVGQDPCTFMYGSSNETLVQDTVREKWYPMFERCVPTRHWVPPESRRIQKRINLNNCTGYCAWSGSPTQLADKDPKYLHGGEIDKWDKKRREEADSLDLFLERGIEIPDRKAILESTPQITNRSRVEKHLTAGWNCRFQVPCPHCKRFQEIVFGDGDPQRGGVIFDKKDGHLDAMTALKTARYRCAHCHRDIDEDRRRWMIQRGIWVPEGQYCTKAGRLVGEMKNPGPRASFQLARLYAPTFTFGMHAEAFVNFHKRGETQNWLNSWMGLTWQPVMSTDEWQTVATRMSQPYSLGTVPKGGAFLVAAVDVQVDHWIFMVMAFGPDQAAWIVDYGTAYSWLELRKVLSRAYPHEDGGEPLPVMMTLCDAKDGNRQDEVIDFCRSVNRESGPYVWPCYGAKAGVMGLMPYRRNLLETGNKLGKTIHRQNAAAFCVVTVNTNYWQQWIHNALYHRKPGEARSMSIPRSSETDQELFEQLTNELPDTRLDMTNHENYVWTVVNETIRVDFRDTARYCRCAAEVYTRGNWERVHRHGGATTITAPTPAPAANDRQARSRRTKPEWIRKHRNRHYGRGRK